MDFVLKILIAISWVVALNISFKEFFKNRDNKNRVFLITNAITFVLLLITYSIPNDLILIKLGIVFLYLTVLAMYYAERRIMKTILMVFLFFVFMNIVEFLVAIVFIMVLKLDMEVIRNDQFLMFTGSWLNTVVFVALVKLVNIKKSIHGFMVEYTKKQRMSILGFVGLTILVMLGNSIVIVTAMEKHTPVSMMFLVIIFALYGVFILGFLSVNKTLNVKTEEYEQLKFYTTVIENLVEESNKFRHDYRNVMLTFDGYMRNDEYGKLRKFYDTVINESSNSVDSSFYQLKYIKDSGVKGLLTTKMSNIVSSGINFEFEAKDEIEINMNMIDFSRIAGVFIDNAKEAALESEEKNLRMGFLVDDETVTFVIANTFGEKPNINDIFKKGKSSKGSGRGTGLSNVREILDKSYSNVILNTSIEGNYFIQEMIIDHE